MSRRRGWDAEFFDQKHTNSGRRKAPTRPRSRQRRGKADSANHRERRDVLRGGTGVCTMMGCWMALAPTDAPKGPAILIKVDDGVIVFPTSAGGKRATAQGVVERVGSADAEGQEAAREHAQHEGRPASPSGSTETARWQIKATGAIIY